MANEAHVSMVGTLGKDAELRFTASGACNATFSMAVNRRYQRNGEWVEETSWFNVVAWGQLAENVVESVAKGSRVMVSGRLQQRSWETDSGEKRYVIEVVADEIGPSLRWATAKVERNERREGDEGVRTGGGTASPPAPRYDEEPF